MSKYFRGFVHTGGAWYSNIGLLDDEADSISIGLYCQNGGCDAEFVIRWKRCGSTFHPSLEVFNDAWLALQQFNDVLLELSLLDDKKSTPEEITLVLKKCGLRDITPREESE